MLDVTTWEEFVLNGFIISIAGVKEQKVGTLRRIGFPPFRMNTTTARDVLDLTRGKQFVLDTVFCERTRGIQFDGCIVFGFGRTTRRMDTTLGTFLAENERCIECCCH